MHTSVETLILAVTQLGLVEQSVYSVAMCTSVEMPCLEVNIISSPHPSHPLLPLLQTEVESGYLQSQANRYGYVLAACDWWGMAEFDEPAVIYMMAMNIGDFGIIPERLTQGMLNALLLMKMLKVGRCLILLAALPPSSCKDLHYKRAPTHKEALTLSLISM